MVRRNFSDVVARQEVTSYKLNDFMIIALILLYGRPTTLNLLENSLLLMTSRLQRDREFSV